MSEAAYFPESWPLIVDFFTLFITLNVGSGTVIVMHFGSSSAKGKSYISCGYGSCYGSTTLQKNKSSYVLVKH